MRLVAVTKSCCRDKDFDKNSPVYKTRSDLSLQRDAVTSRPTCSHDVICRRDVLLLTCRNIRTATQHTWEPECDQSERSQREKKHSALVSALKSWVGGEFLRTPCLAIFAVFFVSRDLGAMLTQCLATLVDRYMIVHELVEKFTSSF